MKKKYAALAGICAIAAVCCAIWLVKYFLNTRQGEAEQESLRENYIEEAGAAEPEGPVEEGEEAQEEAERAAREKERQELLAQYAVPEKKIDFEAMREEQNEDIYAWITVPDTKIDYPILQHPEELDYYLDHNMDGSTGYPGCIYTQFMNSRDFTDPHTVIYGHNMKDGSMFAGLHYYEDPEFFEGHPYFYIYMEEKVLVYQVYAAYEFPGAHLLMGFDTSTPEKFQEFALNLYNMEGLHDQFDESIKPEINGESRIVTLSTCISGKSDRRWLVTGILKAEIETDREPAGENAPEGNAEDGKNAAQANAGGTGQSTDG